MLLYFGDPKWLAPPDDTGGGGAVTLAPRRVKGIRPAAPHNGARCDTCGDTSSDDENPCFIRGECTCGGSTYPVSLYRGAPAPLHPSKRTAWVGGHVGPWY